MDPAIEIRSLRKHFGRKPAVAGLNLTVPRGSIFALLGDNGAGKTTTIRMLTGLLRPDRGSAAILGQDCWHAAIPLRHHVGYVPERPRFYDWMRVAEIGWFTAGFHWPGFLQRYRELTTQVSARPQGEAATPLQGAVRQGGPGARLAPDPEVLILDEPTSGLDLLTRRQFLSSMVDLASEGRTILISSHQIAEVERVASHVAFLTAGRLLLTAPMDELRQRIVRLRLRYAALPPDASALGTVLQRNGSGKQWQVVVKDPDPEAVAALRNAEGIHDFEEAPLALEEVYCALMAGEET